MKAKLLYSLFIALFLFSQASTDEKFRSLSQDFTTFPNSRVEFGYNAGQFIGIRHNYAELGIFLPAMYKERWLTFADAKVYRFQNCKWAASAGVGTRIWTENQTVFGTNIFYDYMEGAVSDGFHRMALGIEWLSQFFDVRINCYIPVNARSHSKLFVYHNYIGNYLVTCKDRESCIHEGFDAEIGQSIGYLHNFSFYAAVGPYYYYARHDKSYWGGQARLNVYWNDYLSLQIRTSYDGKYRSHTQARFLLSIPIDKLWWVESLDDSFAKLLTQPVVRNGIIFKRRCCQYTTNY